MAEQFPSLSDELTEFIGNQHIYFVGTAGAEGKVNVSPKGMDSLRVVGPNEVVWLNYTGSGNESAAHVMENERMTIMFCSFDRQPLILRLYGKAEVIYPRHEDWQSLLDHFESSDPDFETGGARQFFRLNIDMVQTSCGFAVPFYELKGERDTLKKWTAGKTSEEMSEYWQKNQVSLDGKPTHIFADS